MVRRLWGCKISIGFCVCAQTVLGSTSFCNLSFTIFVISAGMSVIRSGHLKQSVCLCVFLFDVFVCVCVSVCACLQDKDGCTSSYKMSQTYFFWRHGRSRLIYEVQFEVAYK